MISAQNDLAVLFSEASLRPPQDALARHLLSQATDRPLPLGVYSLMDGGAIGRFDLLHLSQIARQLHGEGLPENAQCVAIGPDATRFFWRTDGEHAGAVFRQDRDSSALRCSPDLPSFYRHLIEHGDQLWQTRSKTAHSFPPSDEPLFGLRYSSAIADQMAYLPQIRASIQWAFRRAPALDEEGARLCLQGFAAEVVKSLPHAYSSYFIPQEALDLVLNAIVHPFILDLLAPLNDGDRDRVVLRGQELTEALFVATLSDIGEDFIDIVESLINELIDGYEGLLLLNKSANPPSLSHLCEVIDDYNSLIDRLPQNMHDLLPELTESANRLGAAQDFLSEMNLEWALNSPKH